MADVTFPQAFAEALKARDLPKLGRMMDYARAKLRLRYHDLCELAGKAGIDAEEFEAIAQDVDALEGEGGES